MLYHILAKLVVCLSIFGHSRAQYVNLTGINFPSLEFSVYDNGTVHYDVPHDIPKPADMKLWKDRGFNFVRLGFTWQFLQPSTSGAFNSTYLGYIVDAVNTLLDLGYTVSLDCHNYGRRGVESIIGQGGSASNADFADLWTRLASILKGQPRVMFSLMNEPHKLDFTDFRGTMQSAINAIRTTGAIQPILVQSNNYNSFRYWLDDVDELVKLVDPLNSLIYDMHGYFDDNGSGESGTNCISFDQPQNRPNFQLVTDKIRALKGKAILSEFGGMATEACVNTIYALLSFMDVNSDVWLGWNAWGSGLDGPGKQAANKLYYTYPYNEQTHESGADELFLGPQDGREYELVSNALIKHGFVAANQAAGKPSVGQVPIALDISKIECFPNGVRMYDQAALFKLVAMDPIIVPPNSLYFQFKPLSMSSISIQSTYKAPQSVTKASILNYISVIQAQCQGRGLFSGGYVDIPSSLFRIVLDAT